MVLTDLFMPVPPIGRVGSVGREDIVVVNVGRDKRFTDENTRTTLLPETVASLFLVFKCITKMLNTFKKIFCHL
jgi:hypothetical protein